MLTKEPHHQRIRNLPILVGVGFSAVLIVFAMLLDHATPASAEPPDLAGVEAQYPVMVGSRIDACVFCHTSSIPNLNPFGMAYLANGRNSAALVAIQNLDSDGDGFTNIQEINALTFPGDPNDHPAVVASSTPTRAPSATALPTMTRTPTAGPTSTRTATTAASATNTAIPSSTPTAGAYPPPVTATAVVNSPTPVVNSPTPGDEDTSTPTLAASRTPAPSRTPGGTLAPTRRATSQDEDDRRTHTPVVRRTPRPTALVCVTPRGGDDDASEHVKSAQDRSRCGDDSGGSDNDSDDVRGSGREISEAVRAWSDAVSLLIRPHR